MGIPDSVSSPQELEQVRKTEEEMMKMIMIMSKRNKMMTIILMMRKRKKMRTRMIPI